MLLTIQSENRSNVTSRVDGFDVSRIISYIAMPAGSLATNGETLAGNTLLVYKNSASDFANQTTLYGVTETVAYIAAGGQTSANTIFTVKKTFGWSGASNVDFLLPSAVNTTAYNMDLGSIIPANARILDAKIICTEAGTGAVTLVAGIGNASAGTQISASATIFALNSIVGNMACINTPIACNASASKIWVTDITPGANWSLMSAGKWEVFITYNDASSL